ncbi:epoxide hydrolase 2-like isoform X1 [Nicotiana sylvestris]|uniref:Bifunctional epoxide hydrolase 2-like isoform X1 n=1 Tax=Nicotiana sylvestris TaxID=4096 RepID=A0A1U7WK74_NICSY|nr:PREDICTED: bifunctional epoxide hydrolase 2-like isoform X1 [Nicotiana sylvestris]
MEEIKHKFIEVNGLKLHVAEIGSESSPAVVFLHGFPEIWYSWRYQMIAMAKAGFRAIAFDYRGYGLSEQPTEPEKTTFLDFDNDLLELLDALNIPKAFLVGKDFAAFVISLFVVLHEERVSGFVTMGVPFMLPGASDYGLPEGFYITRWMEPGRAEADFGRFDAKTVVRKIYILFSRSEIPIADENQEILDLVEPGTPLPYWFSEKDLAIYGAKYEKSGFRTALQVPYRAMAEQLNVTARTVQVPAMLIMGEKDYVLKFPGMEDYIRGEELKSLVPKLEIVFMRKGTHFVQEQMPNEVNQLLLSFLLQNKST